MSEPRPQPVIGFDGSRLTARSRTGTETYAFELLNALFPLTEPGELRLYLNADTVPASIPVGIDSVTITAPRLWTHGRLSWEMSRRPPEVLFVPAHVIPAFHPLSVVTIHDLAYLVHPGAFTKRQRQELDIATRWNARVATKIIAVSRQTKADLIDHYGTDPRKVVVIHHGVSSRFRPAGADAIERVRAAHRLENPYVLCVGTLHPRKNYPAVIAAFEVAAGEGLSEDLVICGEQGRHAASTLQAIEASSIRERIHYLNYVDAIDLPALYSGASLVMLASLYEGFGMPALEAMSCGAPIAASITGALPEVAGNAARYVDPLDRQSISAAMLDMCGSTGTRTRLGDVGRQWASRFTWNRSAALTMNVLRSVRDGKDVSDEHLGWADLAASGSPGGFADGDNA